MRVASTFSSDDDGEGGSVMAETDGIEEAAAQLLQTATMTAAQIVEHLARDRQQRLHADADRARDATRRLERDTAARGRVDRNADRAQRSLSPPATGRAATAAALAGVPDREAVHARLLLDRARAHPVGVSVSADTTRTPGTSPAGRAAAAQVAVVLAADQARDIAQTAAGHDIHTVEGRGVERPPSRTGVGGMDTTGADRGWDAQERRDAFAASLADVPDRDAVEARLLLDRARAHPASAAAHPAATPATAARAFIATPEVGRAADLGR